MPCTTQYVEQWAVYNRDGAPIAKGAAFNIAVSAGLNLACEVATLRRISPPIRWMDEAEESRVLLSPPIHPVPNRARHALPRVRREFNTCNPSFSPQAMHDGSRGVTC